MELLRLLKNFFGRGVGSTGGMGALFSFSERDEPGRKIFVDFIVPKVIILI